MPDLDALDRQILELLTEDGRISYAALGDRIGLSANAAADRVRNMVRRGVITGFTAQVDESAGTRSLEAVIDLRLKDNESRPRFEQLLRESPVVVGAVHLTGPFDYQLRLACGDATEIDAVVGRLKNEGGVRDTQTRVVLRRVK